MRERESVDKIGTQLSTGVVYWGCVHTRSLFLIINMKSAVCDLIAPLLTDRRYKHTQGRLASLGGMVVQQKKQSPCT